MEQKRNKASTKKQIKFNMEQKYRDRGTKKGTRLAWRNKLNLNVEQKYRNHGTKKEQSYGKEQIEFKHGTKL
jgi:hypothetical protein